MAGDPTTSRSASGAGVSCERAQGDAGGEGAH